MFDISQLIKFLTPLVIEIIVFIVILFVVVIPFFRLGVGYLKNAFTPQRKIPQKIIINTNTLTSVKTCELSEKKLLNYIKNRLTQHDYMYFNGGSKLFVSFCLENKKSVIDKILKWDQVTYTIQFTPKY